MSAPYPQGTLVRVTAYEDAGDTGDVGCATPGEYLVYSFVSEHADDNDDPQHRAYYLLDRENDLGGALWAYAEHVVLVLTVEQLAARKIPTLFEVSQAVASGLHHLMNDGMEFNETEIEGPQEAPFVRAYGRTDEGLPIAVKIAVLRVEESDW